MTFTKFSIDEEVLLEVMRSLESQANSGDTSNSIGDEIEKSLYNKELKGRLARVCMHILMFSEGDPLDNTLESFLQGMLLAFEYQRALELRQILTSSDKV